MEEEYGRSLQKLARNTAETYALHEGKAGSITSLLLMMLLQD
jgi:Rho GTPase-activating protein RGD1